MHTPQSLARGLLEKPAEIASTKSTLGMTANTKNAGCSNTGGLMVLGRIFGVRMKHVSCLRKRRLGKRSNAMGYRWFIDDFSGPPHTNLVNEADCPNRSNRTPMPMGYIARQEWSKRMSKTHRQITCEQCGLWVIWLPKAEAKAVLAERKKREAALVKRCRAKVVKV